MDRDHRQAAAPWCRTYAVCAGAPERYNLLCASPLHFCPAWQCGGTPFAASALLAGGRAADSLAPRLFWRLGWRDAFFAAGTAFESPVHPRQLRAVRLVPATLACVLPPASKVRQASEDGSAVGCSRRGPAGSKPEGKQAGAAHARAQKLASVLAADMQPWAVRLLGWVLARLFRRVAHLHLP